MMVQALFVAKQMSRAMDLRDDHIQVAVSVNIGVGRTAPGQRLVKLRATVLRRHQAETAFLEFFATVPEQLRRLLVTLIRPHLLNVWLDMTVGREEVEV